MLFEASVSWVEGGSRRFFNVDGIKGRIIVIKSPNASGKTTFLRGVYWALGGDVPEAKKRKLRVELCLSNGSNLRVIREASKSLLVVEEDGKVVQDPYEYLRKKFKPLYIRGNAPVGVSSIAEGLKSALSEISGLRDVAERVLHNVQKVIKASEELKKLSRLASDLRGSLERLQTEKEEKERRLKEIESLLSLLDEAERLSSIISKAERLRMLEARLAEIESAIRRAGEAEAEKILEGHLAREKIAEYAREIEATKERIRRLRKELQKAEEDIRRLSSELKNIGFPELPEALAIGDMATVMEAIERAKNEVGEEDELLLEQKEILSSIIRLVSRAYFKDRKLPGLEMTPRELAEKAAEGLEEIEERIVESERKLERFRALLSVVEVLREALERKARTEEALRKEEIALEERRRKVRELRKLMEFASGQEGLVDLIRERALISSEIAVLKRELSGVELDAARRRLEEIKALIPKEANRESLSNELTEMKASLVRIEEQRVSIAKRLEEIEGRIYELKEYQKFTDRMEELKALAKILRRIVSKSRRVEIELRGLLRFVEKGEKKGFSKELLLPYATVSRKLSQATIKVLEAVSAEVSKKLGEIWDPHIGRAKVLSIDVLRGIIKLKLQSGKVVERGLSDFSAGQKILANISLALREVEKERLNVLLIDEVGELDEERRALLLKALRQISGKALVIIALPSIQEEVFTL